MSENETNVVQGWVASQLEHTKMNEIVERAVRDELLRLAGEKPIRTFMQFDYFDHNTGVAGHDGDFDMFGGARLELRNSDCLRVQIPDYFTRDETVEALERIRDWIEEDDEIWNMANSEAAAAKVNTVAHLLNVAKNAKKNDIPF